MSSSAFFIKTQGVFNSLTLVEPHGLPWNLIDNGFLLAYDGWTTYVSVTWIGRTKATYR